VVLGMRLKPAVQAEDINRIAKRWQQA